MEDKKIREKWNELLFGVRRSFRYHTHRRKFFDKLSVWSDFLVIISGGTVVGFASSSETGHRAWMIVFGALVAIIGSFDLVIGFSNRARDFHDLAREFSELERQMTAAQENRTEKDLIAFTNRRLEIEEEEPPILQVLNCYCHNELIKALEFPEKEKVKITFWQSFFKQWFDLFPSSLGKNGEKNEPQKTIFPQKVGVISH
jgi:hypothetical protein